MSAIASTTTAPGRMASIPVPVVGVAAGITAAMATELYGLLACDRLRTGSDYLSGGRSDFVYPFHASESRATSSSQRCVCAAEPTPARKGWWPFGC